MAQQPQSLSQIYKQFTDTFSPTENPRDVVRFAKRRLSVQLKYRDVKKFLSDKKKWDERVCEPLDGEFGEIWLFETIQQSSYYQKWLIDCYFKQKHKSLGGLVSLGIIWNAKLLSNYYLSKYDNDNEDDQNENDHKNIDFDSDDEEDMDTLKTTLPFLTESKLIHIFPQYSSHLTIDKVLVEGMGLDQLGQVLLDFGCKSVNIQHCNNMNKQTISEFRNLCRQTFTRHNMTIDHAIICNFDLWELETGIELDHISPIAAYHEISDRVLLLDTFIDQSWVKIESLYKAMATTSAKTGKFRGYVVAQGTPVFSNNNHNIERRQSSFSFEGGSNLNNNNNIIRNRNRNNKSRYFHRKNNSSIDFDFVFDTKQNYNDKNNISQLTKQQHRLSRRLSKKLRLYLEFDSENGQQLWKETQSSPYHQKYLIVEYFQQQNPTNYGLVTIAIILNAKCIANYHNNDDNKNNNDGPYDSDDDDQLFEINEDKMVQLYQNYYNENINKQLNVPKISKLLSKGMSLEQCQNICKLFGIESVILSYSYQLEINQFRDLIKNTLKTGSQNSDNVLLVNYDLYKLGTGIANGHISCVAGYNEKNDMVLIMDPMWIIGKIWVPLSLLYESMNTIDDNIGKYRGCIVLNGLPLINDK